MSAQSTTSTGPSVGPIISTVQWVARTATSLFGRGRLGGVGKAISFAFIPNSSLGGSIATTAATVTTTAAQNTSALWMPVFLETTMGKPMAWATITFFGIPNPPSYVLAGAAIGSYMVFTSVTNAIQWARTKSPEQVERIMLQLRDNIEASQVLVAEKREWLERIEAETLNHEYRTALTTVSEYSKERGGENNIEDLVDLQLAREAADTRLRNIIELQATRGTRKADAAAELAEAEQRLAMAQQRLEEAEASFAAQLEQLEASSSTGTSHPVESAEPIGTLIINGIVDEDGLEDFIMLPEQSAEELR